MMNMGYFPIAKSQHNNTQRNSDKGYLLGRGFLGLGLALSICACGPEEDLAELLDEEFGQSVQAQSRWGGGSGGGGNGSIDPEIAGATGHMFTASVWSGQHIWINYCNSRYVDADGTMPQMLQLYDLNGGNLENGDIVNLLAGNAFRGFNVDSNGDLRESHIDGNYNVLLTPQYQFRIYNMSGSGPITTSNTPATQVTVNVALQAVVNNLYVMAQHGGGHRLSAVAFVPYGWETFTFSLTAGLRNVSNYHGCFG
ncbi:MAG: hypothetical protein AAF449_06320 [Myxococcota bacterium]